MTKEEAERIFYDAQTDTATPNPYEGIPLFNNEPPPFYQLYFDEPDWWAADAWTFGYTAAMGLCFTFNWHWGKIRWAR